MSTGLVYQKRQTQHMTTAKIVQLFRKNLPSVQSGVADELASRMQTYHDAFKRHQNGTVNYECAPEYYTSMHEILMVQQDDLWIHAPHFKKFLGLTIGELFKTKITMICHPSNVGISTTTVLVDAHFNRWVVSFKQSDADLEKICISISLPVSGTKTSTACTKNAEELNNPFFNASGVKIFVQDTSAWFED